MKSDLNYERETFDLSLRNDEFLEKEIIKIFLNLIYKLNLIMNYYL